MVFIRPTILRDNVQASFETNAKYNYIRDEQLAINPVRPRLMPLTKRPTLPELGPPKALSPLSAPLALRQPALHQIPCPQQPTRYRREP